MSKSKLSYTENEYGSRKSEPGLASSGNSKLPAIKTSACWSRLSILISRVEWNGWSEDVFMESKNKGWIATWDIHRGWCRGRENTVELKGSENLQNVLILRVNIFKSKGLVEVKSTGSGCMAIS
jgi:hypothetical protein